MATNELLSTSFGAVQPYIPIIGTLIVGIILVAILGGILWFVLQSKKKKIYCRIWEKRAGNTYHHTRADVLIRSFFNKGKEEYWSFKFTKEESVPPPNNFIVRFNKKNFADMMRLDDGGYIPLEPKIEGDRLIYTPMDYDVNIIRIQAIDRREKMYMNKDNWWQKYGGIITLIVLIGAIVIVLYMTFDFVNNAITQATGVQNQIADKLGAIAERLG